MEAMKNCRRIFILKLRIFHVWRDICLHIFFVMRDFKLDNFDNFIRAVGQVILSEKWYVTMDACYDYYGIMHGATYDYHGKVYGATYVLTSNHIW